jgi:hypothetical protein
VGLLSHDLLVQALTTIRDAYLAFYRRVLAKLREEGVEFGVEANVMVGRGDNPHGSRFNLPVRVDVLRQSEQGPQVLAVELDELPEVQSLAIQTEDGREVVVTPFHWNRCDILFEGAAEPWGPVLQWFERWYDRDEDRVPDGDGLRAVIHALGEPVQTPHGKLVTVDLGSAPVEAAEELFVTLHELGLGQIRVGSFVRAADS